MQLPPGPPCQSCHPAGLPPGYHPWQSLRWPNQRRTGARYRTSAPSPPCARCRPASSSPAFERTPGAGKSPLDREPTLLLRVDHVAKNRLSGRREGILDRWWQLRVTGVGHSLTLRPTTVWCLQLALTSSALLMLAAPTTPAVRARSRNSPTFMASSSACVWRWLGAGGEDGGVAARTGGSTSGAGGGASFGVTGMGSVICV